MGAVSARRESEIALEEAKSTPSRSGSVYEAYLRRCGASRRPYNRLRRTLENARRKMARRQSPATSAPERRRRTPRESDMAERGAV